LAVEVTTLPASDLTICYGVNVDGQRVVLQRKETDSRIQHLRDEWDDDLCGILVGHRLTDHPTTPGLLHLGDGGCRWRAKTDTSIEGETDKDYLFTLTIEDVTMKESARRHDAINRDRKAESKLDQYLIGLTAEKDWAVEIKLALDNLGLKMDRFPSFGNGHPGTVASVVGCVEAVTRGHGAEHLHRVLALTRRAFSPTVAGNNAYYAHDGDLIKAVSRIWLRGRNPDVLAQERNRLRLAEKLGDRDPSWWKSRSNNLAVRARDTEGVGSGGGTPGSGGRPQYLAALIVWEYNKMLRDETRKLQNPGRVVVDD
jgi:hypothetical protein